MDVEGIYKGVSERYSTAANFATSAHGNTIAQAFGYTEEELSSAPEGSNLGLSWLATATLRKDHALTLCQGETVIGLGSGAGFDVFLASDKLGSSGKAIGIDMNKDMLAKARQLQEGTGKKNVEFVECRITHVALPSGIADCIISNCVVNLVPEQEKQLVFNEIKPLPDNIRQNMSLYVGCIAGASQVAAYEEYLSSAGFTEVMITDAKADLDVYNEAGEASCCGTADGNNADSCCAPVKGMVKDLQGQDMNQWAGSFRIYAVKQ